MELYSNLVRLLSGVFASYVWYDYLFKASLSVSVILDLGEIGTHLMRGNKSEGAGLFSVGLKAKDKN